MKLGICTSNLDAVFLKQAGYAYIELPTFQTFPIDADADAWAATVEKIKASVLPVEVCNGMLPPETRIVGPEKDHQWALDYMDRVFDTLASFGCHLQVFGSGGARRVPEGYAFEDAWSELVEFARRLGPQAGSRNITVVMEHLRDTECNILTSLEETARFVREVNHPNIQLLCDGFHMAQMKEPYENINKAAEMILHVHLADPETRKAPTEASDLEPLLAALKSSAYDARMSLECGWEDQPAQAAGVHDILLNKWLAV